MKKTLLLVALLLAATVGVASAAGINVNWGLECYTDAPLSAITWACNVNTYSSLLPGAGGSNTIAMTCSYALPTTKTNVVATDVYMEGITNSAAVLVPDWWKLGDGECRGNPNIVGAVALTGAYAGSGPCVDYYQGTGGGGLGLYSDEGNRAHINGTWATPDPIQPVNAEEETFAVTYKIKTGRTVGTGACGGCLTPFTWALNYIQVAFLGEYESLQLGNPIGNQCLQWQNGVLPERCGIVPARTTTWGQVKSLYR